MANENSSSQAAIQNRTLQSVGIEFLDCIHCGLCLSSCPTFVELGVEMDSPRGRIYLMRALSESRMDITDNYVKHIELCLGCRACETACPSTVHFEQMLEQARFQIKEQYKKSIFIKIIYSFMLNHILIKHKALQILFAILFLLQKYGIDRRLKNSSLLKLFPRTMRDMFNLLPQLPDPEIRMQVREHNTPEGEIKSRVGLLRGCIADFMFSDVNLATLRVLNLNGIEVTVPKNQVCCGALHIHNGYLKEAKKLARKNIDVFEAADVESVVVNSAGCGAAMKGYDHLLADDPSYAERAKQFVKKIKDISEYLIEIGAIPASNSLNKKVVYHDACHLCHGQQIRNQPREVLTKLAGAEILPLNESEFCCGSAGIYNITHSEMANKLLERKINNIIDAEGDIVAAGNPGCLIQIKAGMKKYGKDLPVAHTIELLDMAYQSGKKE